MRRVKAVPDTGRGEKSQAGPPGAGDTAARGANAADPELRKRQLSQARSLWERGKWQEAEAAFRAIPAVEDDPRSLLVHASCLRELGRHDEAAQLLDAAAEKAGQLPLFAIEQIKLALDIGQYADALSTAEAAVERFAKHAHLRMLLGRALAATHARDRAVEAFRAAIELGAGATARAELAKLVDVRDAAARGRPAGPKGGRGQDGAHAALLRLRKLREDWDDARRIAEAEKAAQAYPGFTPITLQWAIELREAGQFEKAEALLMPLSADGEDVAACVEYALVISTRGNRPDAVAYMERVIDRHPEHARAFLVWFFMTLDEIGREAATAKAERRIRQLGKSRLAPKVISEVSNQLILIGRHDRVLSLVDGVDGDDRELALLNAMGARAALEAGETDRARGYFAEAVLRLCDPVVGRRLAPLLEEGLFAGRKSAVQEISSRLRISLERPDVDLNVSAPGGMDARARLEDLVTGQDPGDRSSKRFMDIVFACHDAGQYDLIPQFVSKFGDFSFLARSDLETLIHLLSLDQRGDLLLALIDAILRGTEAGDERNLYWRLYRALHLGRADDSILEVEKAIGNNAVGRPLVYFLALSIDQLRGICAGGPAEAAANSIARSLPNLIRSQCALSFVDRERRITSVMRHALPRPRPCLVTLLIPVHRQQDLANVRRNLVRQTWADLEAIIMPNGAEVSGEAVAAALGDLPFVRIRPSPHAQIGKILNQGAAEATGEYVLRFDADDIYLDHYVTNMVSSLQSSEADLIYKNSTFVYVESIDHIVLIDRGPDLVTIAGGNGASQGYRADTLRRYKFPENVVRSEDIHFARKIAADGGKVLSVDPFDFVVVRRRNKSTHTWHAPDFHLYGEPLPLGSMDIIEALSLPVGE